MESPRIGSDIFQSLKQLISPVTAYLLGNNKPTTVNGGEWGQYENTLKLLKIPSPEAVKYRKSKYINKNIELWKDFQKRLLLVEPVYKSYLEIGKGIVTQHPEKYNLNPINPSPAYSEPICFQAYLESCDNSINTQLKPYEIAHLRSRISGIESLFVSPILDIHSTNSQEVLSTFGLQQIEGTKENLDKQLASNQAKMSLNPSQACIRCTVICDYLLAHHCHTQEEKMRLIKIKLEAARSLGLRLETESLAKSILSEFFLVKKVTMVTKNIFIETLEILINHYTSSSQFSLAIKELDKYAKSINRSINDFTIELDNHCQILKCKVYLETYSKTPSASAINYSQKPHWSLVQARSIINKLIQNLPPVPQPSLPTLELPELISESILEEYSIIAKYQDEARMAGDIEYHNILQEFLQKIMLEPNSLETILLDAKVSALTGAPSENITLEYLLNKFKVNGPREIHTRNILKVLEAYMFLMQGDISNAMSSFGNILELEESKYSKVYVKFLAHLGLTRCALETIKLTQQILELKPHADVHMNIFAAKENLYNSINYLVNSFHTCPATDSISKELEVVVKSISKSLNRSPVTIDISTINSFEMLCLQYLVIDLS